MKAYKAIPVLLALLTTAGCSSLVVPDYNNPDIGTVSASRLAFLTQVQGLFIGARAGIAGRAGYVSELGILGRESYNFDAADPRFATELLRDNLDGGNGAFGGNHWAARYAGFRDAKEVLDALDAAQNFGAGALTTSEAAAISGLAQTLQALDLLLALNTRDDLGIVVTAANKEDATGDPEPIVTKSAAQTAILTLLDDGFSDLSGSTFPDDLGFPSGLTQYGFNTASGFAEFNRALKARLLVYMQDYPAALTALGQSFIDDGASLDIGPYYSYGTGSGDQVNNLFVPANNVIMAHPSIVADAEAGDGRLAKVTGIDPTSTTGDSLAIQTDQGGLGLQSRLVFRLYNLASAAVPIIRNEELILLRAEANLGCTGTGASITCTTDATALGDALDDINIIRNAAGLTDLDWTGFTDRQRLDALLYEKRYSLMFEGGHRWLDLRRYGLLNELLDDNTASTSGQTEAQLGLVVHTRFPFPQSECNARPGAGLPTC